MGSVTTIDTNRRVGNKLFLRNMESLWRCDATLALAVDAVPDERRLLLESTKSGHWTAAIDASEGRRACPGDRPTPDFPDEYCCCDRIERDNLFSSMG